MVNFSGKFLTEVSGQPGQSNIWGHFGILTREDGTGNLVRNYYYSLRNNPEERGSLLRRS